MDDQGKPIRAAITPLLTSRPVAPIRNFTPPKYVRRQTRTRPGGALVYALLAVLVISILTLSVGRLISYHFQAEENARGYARAMYIAEAGGNWQLNRMSRSSRPGVYVAGRIPYADISNTDSPAANGVFSPLNLDDVSEFSPGNVRVWTGAITQSGSVGQAPWTPPHDFKITSVGEDPATGLRRGIQYRGSATGLAMRYSLFGASSLTFHGGTKKSDIATIGRGYAGTNGLLTFTPANRPPAGKTLNDKGQFGGCRLGGARAILQPAPDRWPTGWDFPRLPDTVFWPLIDDYVAGVWNGKSVSDLATENDNAEIYAKQNDGNGNAIFVPLRVNGHIATKLTSEEFDQSQFATPQGEPQPTLLLRARYGSQTKTANLFYFTHLYMRPGDVLILDLRPNPLNPTAIRIVVNNADMQIVDPQMKTRAIVVTNLAYYAPANSRSGTTAYFWMNNTNTPFVYQPNTNINGGNPIIASSPISGVLSEKGTYSYTLGGAGPELRGLVYGNNGYAREGNHAGDIDIHGENGATVGVLVGNHVTLYGRVNANGTATGTAISPGARAPNDVEDPSDPRRYVMFYRVTGYIETNAAGAPISRPTAYGYGAFTP